MKNLILNEKNFFIKNQILNNIFSTGYNDKGQLGIGNLEDQMDIIENKI